MRNLAALQEHVRQIVPFGLTGRVYQIADLTVAVTGFPAPLGAVCRISRGDGPPVEAEVIGFEGPQTLVQPGGDLAGVRHGDRVTLVRSIPPEPPAPPAPPAMAPS